MVGWIKNSEMCVKWVTIESYLISILLYRVVGYFTDQEKDAKKSDAHHEGFC